ncbi:hypothetical protein F4777DRAFT_580142 [Nemania sp. FL0916]|nr:hypothetical protein F4777DRAFT_580142 [Nemania sp. FL0916]
MRRISHSLRSVINRRNTHEEVTFHPTAADVPDNTFRGADARESVTPGLSYDPLPGAPLPALNQPQDSNDTEIPDWLTEATDNLSRDLDTTKKEVEVIEYMLEEIDPQQRTRRAPSRSREARIEMMKACRQHSSARCHILRERLIQIELWTEARAVGQEVPKQAPHVWRQLDTQWQKWLNDQSKYYANQISDSQASRPVNTSDLSSDVDLGIWGPLPYMLSAGVLSKYR